MDVEHTECIVWPGVDPGDARRRVLRAAGVVTTIAGAVMLAWAAVAPVAEGAFATALVAEPGQNPAPSAVGPVPEDCKGIAPTPGSKNDTTQKQLNDGQGIVQPGANSFTPGGTVHFLVLYNPTNKSASFDVRDCVVVFNPGNPNIPDLLALIDPAGHGQIVPTPGSEPAVKGFDAVLDNAEFDFADNIALPGEFDLAWTVPANAPPGALICNYAKDTGGSDVGGKENRKAGGACFQLPAPATTTSTSAVSTTTTSASTTSTTSAPTTTSTSTPSPPPPPIGTTTSTTSSVTPEATTTTFETTTTSEPATSTTTIAVTTTNPTTAAGVTAEAATTTSTIPTAVLGESFTQTPLAFTGEETARMVAVAGTLMTSGGLLMLVASRRRRAARSTPNPA